MKTALFILFLLIIGYLAICLLAWKYQSNLIFHPDKLPPDYIFPFQEDFEEVRLETNDGLRFHNLLFKTENAKKVVLYFHGNGGALDNWGYIAPTFLNRNHDVFIHDFRGYGKSEGTLRSQRQMFLDAKTCYKYLTKKGYREVVIYGRSIGTGVAAKLASEVDAEALILETPYYSLLDLSKHYFPFLPHFLLSRFPLQTHHFLAKVSCPVFTIHGTRDQVIPFSQAQRLATEFPHINFTIVEEGDHNNLEQYPVYQQFLDEALHTAAKKSITK